MNEQELKEIEARAAAATPGPWKGDRYDGTIKYLMLGGKDGQAEVLRVDHKNGHYGFFMSDDISYLESQANEELVKHCREDIPSLCVEVRRLRAALGFYADHSNWEMAAKNLPFRKETKLAQYPEVDGWTVAENALNGGAS